ncbi:MAG TPA: Gfo/Idh/MocA family oxidoreductase [Thermoguttaceae bacterium]|nr:Gfo/Idh/MocA family oxidoreductase [Thermoguttaceae bacterium]
MKRRDFLRRGLLGVAAAPFVVPGAVLGKNGAAAPSERITLGAIGLGSRGRSDLSHFLQQEDVRCVAVCDSFADRRAQGKQMVDKHYGNADCAATRFHEELLDRDDIDALLVVTGDRWHAVLSALAARAGKDVYCEKPFTLTIAEGRALVNLTERYGTVWQCGTQRRSNDSYRFVVQAIRGGTIGKLHTITAFLGGWGGNGAATPEPQPDPEVFDYDRWLGQAPRAPYSRVRVGLWRNHWDTGAGVIADMGAHYFDFAQWVHGSELSGPVEFEGTGVWPEGGFATVPFEVDVEARYADGVRLLMKGGTKGVRFDGDEGWIHLSDEGEITAEPKSILTARTVPRVNWAFMEGHVRNLLECIKTRRRTASHPELAHRAHTIAHCANLCLRLGRKLEWDPAAERFVGDDEANRLLERTMRVPWRV